MKILKRPETAVALALKYRLWREGITPGSPTGKEDPPTSLTFRNHSNGMKFRVLYVVKAGVWDAATLRYRAYNLIEALKTQRIEAFPVDELHLPTSIPELLAYDLIVLARREWGSGIAQLALSAREAGIPLIADFDDYIFDEEVIPFLAAKQTQSAFEIKKFIITPYRNAVQKSDYFTGSLDYLCEKARGLGKIAFSIPNGMNYTQIQLSEKAANDRLNRNRDNTTVTIGYFSGSRTHQADFRVIYGPVLRLMKQENNVHLFICGDFDVSEFSELIQFEGRLHQERFVDWRYLPSLIARSDIQLVPLEDNIFTRAKSQLKYYEAGIIGIPTVASPIPSFANSIKHGKTGFLASTEEEWLSYLKNLVTNPDLRQEIGLNAKADAIANFSPEVIGRKAVTVYQEILRDYRSASTERSKPCAILRIGNPDTAFATRHPLLGLISPLSQLGMRTIVSVPTGTDQQMLEKFRVSPLMGPDTRVLPGDDIPCCDLFIAGDIASIGLLNRFSYRAQSSAYLVVDEPVSPADFHKEIHCFKIRNHFSTKNSNYEQDRFHAVDAWMDELMIPEFGMAAIPEATLLIVLSDLPAKTTESIRNTIEVLQERSPKIPIYGAGLVQSLIANVTSHVTDLYSDEFYSFFMKSPVCVIAGTNANHPLVTGLQRLGYPVVLVETEPKLLSEETPGLLSAQPDAFDIYKGIESLHLDRVLLSRLSIEGKEKSNCIKNNFFKIAYEMLEKLGFTQIKSDQLKTDRNAA